MEHNKTIKSKDKTATVQLRAILLGPSPVIHSGYKCPSWDAWARGRRDSRTRPGMPWGWRGNRSLFHRLHLHQWFQQFCLVVHDCDDLRGVCPVSLAVLQVRCGVPIQGRQNPICGCLHPPICYPWQFHDQIIPCLPLALSDSGQVFFRRKGCVVVQHSRWGWHCHIWKQMAYTKLHVKYRKDCKCVVKAFELSQFSGRKLCSAQNSPTEAYVGWRRTAAAYNLTWGGMCSAASLWQEKMTSLWVIYSFRKIKEF